MTQKFSNKFLGHAGQVMAFSCVSPRSIKSILRIKVAARMSVRKEGPENLRKGSFSTLCASTVSRGYENKYFPGEWTAFSCPFGYCPSAAFDRNHENLEKRRKESPGPEVEDDRPYVRSRASVRQLIHYRPSPPLSSLSSSLFFH